MIVAMLASNGYGQHHPGSIEAGENIAVVSTRLITDSTFLATLICEVSAANTPTL
jgi:hypothetical protein